MSILERLKRGIESSSSEDTISLAAEIAKQLPAEAVITLEGDLGAGKTTFVKGFAQAWDIQDVVTSPTFNIYQLYKGERTLVHMDAYRLSPSNEVLDELMIEDFLTPPFCLAIEWPSQLGPIPWPVSLALSLESNRDGTRSIRSQ